MFILGKKLKMTRLWKGEKAFPVTVIEAGPIVVTQVKNKEKDGYSAIQVGFDATKKRLTKPMAGHLQKVKEKTANMNFKHLREWKTENEYGLGDSVDISVFKEGDKVKVSGESKGRGFQGVVKRHGFHGGPKTHGQKDRHRAPGSIGATAPQRVVPGLRMAGRMGGTRVTLKNLEVIGVDKDKNLLYIKGAVPGTRGSLLEISNV